MLGFEWTVATRFLREGRFQTLLIIGGVAAGIAVVAYISALITGLQATTLERTLGAQAHVALTPLEEKLVTPPPDQPASAASHAADAQVIADRQARAQRLRRIANAPALMEVLARRAGVEAVSPMVSGSALAQRGEASRAVAVSGIDLPRFDAVVRLASKIVDGHAQLEPGEAIVGTALASDLGIRVGDRFVLAAGAASGLRTQTLRVVATVDLGMTDLNRRTVYLPLRAAQSLLDLPGGISRIDLRLRDVWQAQALARELARELPAKVESWQDTNAQLVIALNAQSISTGIIRGVVMVVVVLGIASVLVVSVVQKQREIGILRAMGATRGQVMRVFLLQGAVVGLVGSIVGVLLAALLVQVFVAFVRGSDGQPLFQITLPPLLALQIALLAWAAGTLAAVAPARRAARMDPAQAIRL